MTVELAAKLGENVVPAGSVVIPSVLVEAATILLAVSFLVSFH